MTEQNNNDANGQTHENVNHSMEALRHAEKAILKALRDVRCAMIEDGKPEHRIFEYEAHTNPCDDDLVTRFSTDQCSHVETLRSGKDAVVVLIDANRHRCEVLNSLRWIVSEIERESLNRHQGRGWTDEVTGWELWTDEERSRCSYEPDFTCSECYTKRKSEVEASNIPAMAVNDDDFPF
jgi:hypothetical protein